MNFVYELPHELLNNLRLKILKNVGKILNLVEKYIFGNSTLKYAKTDQFRSVFYFASNIYFRTVVHSMDPHVLRRAINSRTNQQFWRIIVISCLNEPQYQQNS